MPYLAVVDHNLERAEKTEKLAEKYPNVIFTHYHDENALFREIKAQQIDYFLVFDGLKESLINKVINLIVETLPMCRPFIVAKGKEEIKVSPRVVFIKEYELQNFFEDKFGNGIDQQSIDDLFA